MKTSMQMGSLMAGAMFVGLALPAAAVDVAALAERAGLTERQVRMVLGAPSAFVEYRSSYWRATRKLRAILGSDRAMRELVEEFQSEQDYEFEVLVDGVPFDEATGRERAHVNDDRAASVRSISPGRDGSD